jgi:hypothetical protein
VPWLMTALGDGRMAAWRRGSHFPLEQSGVRAGQVTESGAVCSRRVRSIKPYAVNGSAGRAAQVA